MYRALALFYTFGHSLDSLMFSEIWELGEFFCHPWSTLVHMYLSCWLFGKSLYSKVCSLQFIGAAITLLRVVCSCQVCGETREPTGKEEQGQVQDCQFGSESWCGIHSRTGKEGEF